MKLILPEIGTKLQLTTNWSFVLYAERRNSSMFKAIGKTFTYSWGAPETNYIVTIPAGTILTVDRIYVRKGVSDYSSVTFNINKVLNKKNKFAGTRFWAKLSDVNKIEFDFVSCNEQTLNLIKEIDEKTKPIMGSIEQSKFIKELLEGQTVNNIRPQELPSHFVLKIPEAISKCKLSIETKDNVMKELNVLYRSYKIASFLFED